ncbi:tetratricopeptide repeat protein [Trichocoleus sp. FACHB-69]|nr:tetratricopeptide repeat protein [Trichocoleus sp. FACHB-69]
MASNESTYSLNEADQAELSKLVSVIELSSGTTTIFAVAPESGPQHPVVEQLKSLLLDSDEDFQFQNFFYSDNSLHSFLYSLDEVDQQTSQAELKVVMAFGLDQLPTPRMVREMKQLNLGRESLFGRELVLIFWLSQVEFLEEFRNRAPDFWDWRGKVVTFKAHPVINPLFYPYLEWLIAENSYLKISSVMQVQRQVDIFLDQIYVSLQAVRRQQIKDISEQGQGELEIATSRQGEPRHRRKISNSNPYDLYEPCDYKPIVLNPVPVSTSTITVTQKVDLSEAVRENHYSVILGAPGAGKTTLLRYLARHFAVAKRDGRGTVLGNEVQEELGKPLLPIFFRIADYAERLKEQPDLNLLDYLGQFYRHWEAHFKDEAEAEARTELAALLLEQMRQGQCLILLDGLDEVFDQESRRQIVERINQFVENYSANKFVVCSRIAGYRDVKLTERFVEFTIEDMGTQQVEKFLYRWCRSIERAQQPDASEEQWQTEGDAQAQEILEKIKANEGVKRLTANPLLLTILALIHRNGADLPNRRVELYALAVKTLTETWQLGKKLPDAPRVVLKENDVVELLAPLAYWMHEEKPSGLVTQAEVEEQLAAQLAELNDVDPDSISVRQAVEQFLRKVRETTGLFVERAPGVYSFMHLTFEEYFTALHIANTDDISETLNLIRSHLHEPRWDEPILLALGYLSKFFSKRVNKLIEQIFNSLDDYNPAIECGDIKIKNGSSQDVVLSFPIISENSIVKYKQSASVLKNLMFAGQILSQVDVNSRVRLRLLDKLVLTYLGLPELCGTDTEDNITNQILRLLRQIEAFTQNGEVMDCLKRLGNNLLLPEWKRMKVQLALLHIGCGETGTALISYITDVVEQLNPFMFGFVIVTCQNLGEELSRALEKTRQNATTEQTAQQHLSFISALSYIREDHYAQAISLLEELIQQYSDNFKPFMLWALAVCYWEKNECAQALNYYQQAFKHLQLTPEQNVLCCFWQWCSACYLSHRKYKQSLECCKRALTIAQILKWSNGEAYLLDYMVTIYRACKNYEQAVEYCQKKHDFHQQLGQEQDAANQWYRMAECYREFGKYEQAVEFQQHCLAQRQKLEDKLDVALAYYQLSSIYREWGKYEQALGCMEQCLTIRQKLDDQTNLASVYYQLGCIYKDWGKYEQAITYYQQSRELYEQLGQEKNVAIQWYNLADCYREWGQYEQALECMKQCLTICQKLDDQTKIASAYYQLGCIYEDWGKYEQAITYYQQSRELYEQLGQEKNVAIQWYNLADCYREWGQYEQALECMKQCLTICQKLDDQTKIASAYYQLGCIYKDWEKYEQAITYYQQSRDLYEQLYKDENVARCCRQLGNSQRLLAKNTLARSETLDLLAQAEQNIRQAIQLDTAGDYKENLAYDYMTLGLLWSERLRLLLGDHQFLQELITQFEEYYNTGLRYFTELGQTVNQADKTLDMARAYLEVNVLEGLDRAEELAHKSLQVFQDYNRRKLEAATHKLLGEIYLSHGQRNQPSAETTAYQFFAESLKIYRELDLNEKAIEVDQLMYPENYS